VSGDVRNYKDLIVWQKAVVLVKFVYGLVGRFPPYEKYGLADQLRRSVVSIPSNIAEGQARQYPNEFRHFLFTALGSTAEVETQMIIAHDLSYISADELHQLESQVVEIQKMLHALIRRLNAAPRD